MLSLSLGTSLPGLFDGHWGISYTNSVVRPLLSVFYNLTLNKIVLIALWGLAGLATYFLLEYIARAFRSARSTEHDIQFTGPGQAIIHHPARSSFWVAALWRSGVLLIFVPVIILAVKPPLSSLSNIAPGAVLGSLPFAQTVKQLLIVAGELSLLTHCVVVFLRLFAMRMRLFSDDPM